jgi:xylulose-5-phosphate/fructose-6-phosphate phosphoketolase
MDVIDRVPSLQTAGAHAKEHYRNQQIACRQYAYEHGIDSPAINAWRWPGR